MRTLTSYEVTNVHGAFTATAPLGVVGSIAGLAIGIAYGIGCFTMGIPRVMEQNPSYNPMLLAIPASFFALLSTLGGGYIGGYFGRAAGGIIDYFIDFDAPYETKNV